MGEMFEKEHEGFCGWFLDLCQGMLKSAGVCLWEVLSDGSCEQTITSSYVSTSMSHKPVYVLHCLDASQHAISDSVRLFIDIRE